MPPTSHVKEAAKKAAKRKTSTDSSTADSSDSSAGSSLPPGKRRRRDGSSTPLKTTTTAAPSGPPPGPQPSTPAADSGRSSATPPTTAAAVAAPSGPPPGPPPSSPAVVCDRFKGEILEVRFDDAVLLSEKGTSIPLANPHWKAVSGGTAETNPAAIPVKTKPDIKATVKVKVIKSDWTDLKKLNGKLGVLELEGDCPTSVGEHSVSVKVKGTPPETLFTEDGEMVWDIDVPCVTGKNLGTTKIEIYGIVEDTSYPFLSSGRPIEALNFLYTKIPTMKGMSVKDSDNPDTTITTAITQYCHTHHGLAYDTTSGKPYYLISGTDFNLKQYINKHSTKCNCYDQASAVLVFSGIIGLNGTKCFIGWGGVFGTQSRTFGYIKTAKLVGGVDTNSPFYTAAGTGAIVPQLDVKRTSFGNHEFYYNTKINRVFDACAGPVLGGYDLKDYLESVVDTSVVDSRFYYPTLPSKPLENPQGAALYNAYLWYPPISRLISSLVI